jgi:methylated-DNA-[protein]-cysteine S-methyltransferase
MADLTFRRLEALYWQTPAIETGGSAVSDEKLGWTVEESPIGPLTLLAGPRGITNVHFDGHAPRLPEAARRPLPGPVGQLREYFAGRRQAFELDLDLRGAPLRLALWQRLLEIPHGETATYGEIALQIDESVYDPDLEPYRRARVIGAAIGRNPIPVVVPCHRVIGADGSLTGYYGGLERKRVLLELEGWTAPGRASKRSPDSQLAMGL